MSGRQNVNATGRTILVVDDQVDVLTSVRALLEHEGHRVLTANDGTEALALLEREPVQVLLVDYFMPDMDGEELIARVRARDQLIQIVLQTGYADEKPAREMVSRLAIQGYHDKTGGRDPLLMWVGIALRAYDQLVQLHVAESLKTQLLASVSHEFRTPLNVIVGYVGLLREGEFGVCPPETAPVFTKLLGNAAHLLDLTGEFLDLTRLEAGETAMRPEEVPLTPFLRDLGESFALLVRSKPVTFVTDVPDGLPIIITEGAKLRVIIENLLNNAVKFTARGEIRLCASMLDAQRVAIRVSDTGPGIPPEDHEAIFDLFHQLQTHGGSPETKGVGLGLALARRFVRMMNGDIGLDSRLGEGSTFTVMLPVTPLARRDGAAAA